jgi:lipoprotein-releasing system permease protein
MSILAILGVVVSTAAMIVVLSGFSGLKNYSLEFISNVSADLKISSVKGKTFVYTQEMKSFFLEKKISAAKSIEDKTLISINDNSQVVLLKGIDGGFPKKM